MARAKNTKLIAKVECPGGGQVWVEKGVLYVGHMHPPWGTSLIDISDPRNPKLLARIEIPHGWHSHKVRVVGDIMIVNHERHGGRGDLEFHGGLGIYDVSSPEKPMLVTKWRTQGSGVHRFDFDGRYAYISPTAEGYAGNIMMILDLKDPTRPQEIGRWWIPGQWTAGGERDSFSGISPRCHHPIRQGDRLYVSYWHHGFYILDIADITKPKLVASGRRSPAFPHPTHTCLPIPVQLKSRQIMVVADEDVAKLRPAAPAFAWIYDITEEHCPIPIATFQVEGLDTDGTPQPPMMGCHQPSERIQGTMIPFAWFSKGLRILDIADPFAPREVAFYEPDVPAGFALSSSNDVTIDDRGLIYLVDRQHGVDIIETSVF